MLKRISSLRLPKGSEVGLTMFARIEPCSEIRVSDGFNQSELSVSALTGSVTSKTLLRSRLPFEGNQICFALALLAPSVDLERQESRGNKVKQKPIELNNQPHDDSALRGW